MLFNYHKTVIAILKVAGNQVRRRRVSTSFIVTTASDIENA